MLWSRVNEGVRQDLPRQKLRTERPQREERRDTPPSDTSTRKTRTLMTINACVMGGKENMVFLGWAEGKHVR